MGITGSIIVYVLIWWIIFFSVLPVGIQSNKEIFREKIEGTDPGAPKEERTRVRKAKKARTENLLCPGLPHQVQPPRATRRVPHQAKTLLNRRVSNHQSPSVANMMVNLPMSSSAKGRVKELQLPLQRKHQIRINTPHGASRPFLNL